MQNGARRAPLHFDLRIFRAFARVCGVRTLDREIAGEILESGFSVAGAKARPAAASQPPQARARARAGGATQGPAAAAEGGAEAAMGSEPPPREDPLMEGDEDEEDEDEALFLEEGEALRETVLDADAAPPPEEDDEEGAGANGDGGGAGAGGSGEASGAAAAPERDDAAWTAHVPDSVYAVAFHPSADAIVAGGGDEVGRAWAPDAGTAPVRELGGHTDSITAVGFSADGALLATAGCDARALVWDSATGEQKSALEGPAEGIEWLEWHPRGHVILAGAEVRARGASRDAAPRRALACVVACARELTRCRAARTLRRARLPHAGFHGVDVERRYRRVHAGVHRPLWQRDMRWLHARRAHRGDGFCGRQPARVGPAHGRVRSERAGPRIPRRARELPGVLTGRCDDSHWRRERPRVRDKRRGRAPATANARAHRRSGCHGRVPRHA